MKARDFLLRVTELSEDASQLLAEAVDGAEPSPNVALALGSLAAACRVLEMIASCGEPDGWVEVNPCEECGGTTQHKLGCSYD